MKQMEFVIFCIFLWLSKKQGDVFKLEGDWKSSLLTGYTERETQMENTTYLSSDFAIAVYLSKVTLDPSLFPPLAAPSPGSIWQ